MKPTEVLVDIVSVPLFFILFAFTWIVVVPVLYIVDIIEGNKEDFTDREVF